MQVFPLITIVYSSVLRQVCDWFLSYKEIEYCGRQETSEYKREEYIWLHSAHYEGWTKTEYYTGYYFPVFSAQVSWRISCLQLPD